MDNERSMDEGFGATYGLEGFSASSGSARGRDATMELEPDADEIGPVRLHVDDAGETRVVDLEPGDEIVVGSGIDVDVRLGDPTVSSRHASFVHEGHAIEVRDLGSRNGIRIAGARVPRASLGPFAMLELGRVFVRMEPARTSCEPAFEALLPSLVGRSAPMRRLGGAVRRLAPLKLPVLIRGESELFGHQRGAFTGATRDRRGAFREAHKGTLFLDEIASLPLDVQAKLLRVVEEGIARPLGAETGVPVDVRLVVATCEPLEQMVAARRFRADLYERLAVCVVRVPALRERTEDIAALCRHLLASSEVGEREITQGALAALRTHRFPGNVRELRNVIVQAAVRASGAIHATHITAVLAERSGVRRDKLDPSSALRIYEETGGNASEAARRAMLPRSTMRDLLRAAGVGMKA